MPRLHRTATFLILSLLVAGSSYAQELSIIPVPVYLDSRYLGEIDVMAGPADEVSFVPGKLVALVAERVIERVVTDASRLFPGDRRVSPAELAPLGLSATFDWDELALIVEIPPLIRRPERISLSGTRAAPVGTAVAPADISVIANLDLWSRYTYESRLFDLAFTPEIAASIYTVVLEAEGGFRLGDEPLFLNYARVSRDLPFLGYRAQAGDLTWRATELAGVSRVTGISLFREDSMGDAGGGVDEVLERVFLPERSALEIYLNDSRLQRRELGPGNYEIAGVPLGNGRNTIVITWEGEDGLREVEIVVPYDGDLLDERELDAGLALGVADRTIERPLIASYQRYGLTDRLTIGLRQGAEVLDFQIDAGAEILLASLAGTFVFEPSVGIGPANRLRLVLPLRYQYLDTRPSSYLNFGLSAAYSSLTGLESNDNSSVSASGYISLALPEGFSVTPRLGYTYGLLDASHVVDVRAGLRKSIRGGSSVSADVGLLYDSEFSFRATVTYSASFPQRQQNLYLQQNLQAQEFTGYWSRYAGDRARDFDFSASAKVPVDFEEVLTASGQAGYVNRYLRADLSHGLAGVVATSDFRNSTTASAQSALVVADGEFGVSLPVSDSFVIVVPGAEFDAIPVEVSRGGGRTDLMLTGGSGVLPGLRSYTPVGIVVEPVELRLGVENELRFVATPSYRSGTVIRPAPQREVYAGGILLDARGEPAAYQLGSWTRRGSDDANAAESDGEFFTDAEGYFEVYGLTPGTYDLRLNAGLGLEYVLVIPEDAFEYVDADELRPEGQ